MSPIDPDTINKCIKGDRNASKYLYDMYAPYIYSIIKNYLSDKEDQKDCMQEVFAHIYTGLHRYDSIKGEFKNWCAKITVNQSIKYINKKNFLHVSHPQSTDEPTDSDLIKELDSLSLKDVSNMLTMMPVGYRTIFLLSVIDEYTHKEIATMLDISVETSRSQLFRAIRWIKNNVINEINRRE